MNIRKRVNACSVGIVLLSGIAISGCSPNMDQPTVNEVGYGGHNYIVFRVDGQFGQTYVHDPDCPCHNHDSTDAR